MIKGPSHQILNHNADYRGKDFDQVLKMDKSGGKMIQSTLELRSGSVDHVYQCLARVNDSAFVTTQVKQASHVLRHFLIFTFLFQTEWEGRDTIVGYARLFDSTSGALIKSVRLTTYLMGACGVYTDKRGKKCSCCDMEWGTPC